MLFDCLYFVCLFCQSSRALWLSPHSSAQSLRTIWGLHPQSACPIKHNSQLIGCAVFSVNTIKLHLIILKWNCNLETRFYLPFLQVEKSQHNILFITAASGTATGTWANLFAAPGSFSKPGTPWLQLDEVRYDRDFVTWDSPLPFIAPLSLQQQSLHLLASEELKFIIADRKLLKMLCLLVSVLKKICPPPLWKWYLSLSSSRSRFWVTDWRARRFLGGDPGWGRGM